LIVGSAELRVVVGTASDATHAPHGRLTQHTWGACTWGIPSLLAGVCPHIHALAREARYQQGCRCVGTSVRACTCMCMCAVRARARLLVLSPGPVCVHGVAFDLPVIPPPDVVRMALFRSSFREVRALWSCIHMKAPHRAMRQRTVLGGNVQSTGGGRVWGDSSDALETRRPAHASQTCQPPSPNQPHRV
jgi:hypothetical protein